MRPPSRRFSAAFTLVELMLVVGIMAIILAMGVPPMTRIMRREPLRQAESDCMEALAQARAQAILRGVPAEFVISVDEVSPAVVLTVPFPTPSPVALKAAGEESEPATSSVQAAPASQRPAFTARLPASVTFRLLEVNFVDQLESTAESVRVRFYPNGTSDDFVAVLQDAEGLRKISVDPVTALADSGVLR